VLEALGQHGRDAARVVLRKRTANGGWHSYWWTTDLYAAAACLRFLGCTSLERQRDHSRAWILQEVRPRDAFVAGMGLLALSQLEEDQEIRRAKRNLMEMLVDAQRIDGMWPAAAGLCVPDFFCAKPWEFRNKARVFTDAGLFTTATVLRALSESWSRPGYDQRAGFE